VSNALKYGGRPPVIELGASDGGTDMVTFWVRDNGPGLQPDQQRTLFNAYERLDQVSVTGHGLGLSIVREIILKLGGEVGVKSELGRGSTFTFALPAASHLPSL
jgi:signal transduction histidine kinase